MEETTKRIIEIDGVKVEVDLRTAKRVDTFRIGDPVKVLKKEWNGYKPYVGTIVDFMDFERRPTIVLAYVDNSEIKFHHIIANTKKSEDEENVEMIPVNPDEMTLEKSDIIKKLNNKIKDAEEDLRKAKATKEIFLRRFGEVFNISEEESLAA